MKFILHSPIFIPTSCYFLLDLQSLFLKYKIEKKNEIQFYLNANDPKLIPNLGRSEYVFLDKTGTLTINEFKIEGIYQRNQKYSFKNIWSKNFKDDISSRTFEIDLFKNEEGIFRSNNLSSNFHEKNERIPKHSLEKLNSIDNIPDDQSIDEEKIKNFQKYDNFDSKFFNKKMFTKCSLDQKNSMDLDVMLNENKKDSLSPRMKRLHIPLNKSTSSFNRLSLLEKDLKIPSFLENSYYDIEGEFLEAICLCHDAKVTKNKKNKTYHYESSRKDEIEILEFAKNYNYEFLGFLKKGFNQVLGLKINKTIKKKFFLINKNLFSYKRRRFSILLKNSYEENGDFKLITNEISSKGMLLIVKGSEISMRNRLKLDESDLNNLDFMIKAFSQKGLKLVIYAQKLIPEEESLKTQKQIQLMKSSLISQSEELDLLADDLECNMQFLGVIGVKEEVSSDAIDFCQFLCKLKLKVWIVTGDSKESTLNVARNLNFINNLNNEYELISDDRENLGISIRNILISLKNQISNPHEEEEAIEEFSIRVNKKKKKVTLNKMKNKCLVLNGNSLSIILEDNYLLSHFKFISILMNYVLAYNLEPSHKKILTHLVQNEFPGNQSVIAIGNGYNDNLMLKTAKIGIEKLTQSKEDKYISLISSGDIQISNLSFLKNIIIQEGISSCLQNERLIFLIFYMSQVLGFQSVLNNFITLFSLDPIYDSLLLFLINNCFLFCNLFIVGVVKNYNWKKLLNEDPLNAFSESLFLKKNTFKRFFLKSQLESIVHSVFTIVILIYSSNQSISQSGFTYGINITKFIVTISTLSVFIGKVINFFFFIKIIWLILLILGKKFILKL